ncbi:MAG: winged helix DNA-binding domain-containing protein [Actinomycetota bacterium]|nr:winged helix DNA-binding domain-containing protein [Actinomycetota bacterium]
MAGSVPGQRTRCRGGRLAVPGRVRARLGQRHPYRVRVAGIRDILKGLAPQLRTFTDVRGRELFDVLDGRFADPEVPAAPRLLPEFDNVLLSHEDRSRIVPDSLRVRVQRSLGKPMFLLDGFVDHLPC